MKFASYSPTPKGGLGGWTFYTVLIVVVIVAIVAIMGSKIAPSVIEYMSCIKAVKIASKETTQDLARVAFDRYASISDITSIQGKDLDISDGGNGGMIVTFSYDKEIPLVGPVYLLIKYRGKSSSGTKYE